MAAYRKLNSFTPFVSKTICDVTGFDSKSNIVRRQWDGTYVIPEAWSMRQPQDFAPNIIPTMIFPNTRFDYPEVVGNYNIGYGQAISSEGVAYEIKAVAFSSEGGGYNLAPYTLNSTGTRFPLFETEVQAAIV